MASKSASTKKASPEPVISTDMPMDYLDWIFLRSSKGVRHAEKYKKLKAEGRIQAAGARAFSEPVTVPNQRSYFGVTLFRNKRATVKVSEYV